MRIECPRSLLPAYARVREEGGVPAEYQLFASLLITEATVGATEQLGMKPSAHGRAQSDARSTSRKSDVDVNSGGTNAVVGKRGRGEQSRAESRATSGRQAAAIVVNDDDDDDIVGGIIGERALRRRKANERVAAQQREKDQRRAAASSSRGIQ